jgi:DNA polymerase-3 subunit alpha
MKENIMSFVHLRARTEHSISEGLLTPEELVDLAAKNGQPAVAIGDLAMMGGIVKFYKAAQKKGVKPIIGCEVWVDPDITQPDNADAQPSRLLLLCQDNAGYRHLMEMVSRAYLDNNKEVLPRIKQSWMRDAGMPGLIALSGEAEWGEVPRAILAGDADAARKAGAFYKEVFKDSFYLELHRDAKAHEESQIQRSLAFAKKMEIPVVATHPVRFGERKDFFAHEVKAAVGQKLAVFDPERPILATREQGFLSTESMEELFSDIPAALENANHIATRCTVNLDLGKNYLPRFPTPNGESEEDYFADLARKGLADRMVRLFPDPNARAARLAEYEARLEREIATIIEMGFPGYFLIVSDFIGWSKDNDIPVGPGRGSGAGSLVAYSLKITDLDPIEHQLLFERFLNPERVSMPDFDIDFCRERRAEVFGYVYKRYGDEKVSHIATLGTMAARAAIRDVGRALGVSYHDVDAVAKLIPDELGIELKDAIAAEPRLKALYDRKLEVRELLNMAMTLEGRARSVGMHAGGVLIAPTKVTDFSPLYWSEKSKGITSHYDKKDVELVGLVKFDFLGLKNLTMLHQAVALVNQRPEFKNKKLDLADIPLEDEKVLELLRKGDTYGVFQLESPGMTRLVRQLKPDRFDDIVALLALFRPGPLNSGMVDDFVRRKHGEVEVSYPHPSLEKILKPTYGVIVYQEQVMQIAQEIAGYSLGGADLLRRAMGSKNAVEMAKERSKFEDGAKARGHDPRMATGLFDLMEKFAEYGFNRSHSAAYAVLSVQTAYMKARHPAEFYAACMNIDAADTDKLRKAVEDAKKHDLVVLPPDVNKGNEQFEVTPEGCIRYGLSGLKGVSPGSVAFIRRARQEKGEFSSFFDFLGKVGRSGANKTVVEALVRSGGFDDLEPNRALLMEMVKPGMEYSSKLAKQKTEDEGTMIPELFADSATTKKRKKTKKAVVQLNEPELPVVKPWDMRTQLENEHKAVGFYFSRHPYESYRQELRDPPAILSLGDVKQQPLDKYASHLVAGVLDQVNMKNTNAGKSMAHVVVSDGTDSYRVTIFNSILDQPGMKDKLQVGNFVAMEVRIAEDRRDPEQRDLVAEDLWDWEEAKRSLTQSMAVALQKEELPKLEAICRKHACDPRSAEASSGWGVNVYLPDGNDSFYGGAVKTALLKSTDECAQELESTFPGRIARIPRETPQFRVKPPRNGGRPPARRPR